jgi:hypothetical protein
MKPRGLAPAGTRLHAGVARSQKAVLAKLFYHIEKPAVVQLPVNVVLFGE